MNIEILNEIEFEELEERIRKVPLMGKDPDGNEIFVYENSDISFREVKTHEVNHTTFYILEDNLKFQRELREHLLQKYNIDTLHLEKAYELKNEKGEIWTLIPPIIEVTPRQVSFVKQEGEIEYSDFVKLQIPIINDGAHRIEVAHEQGESFTGVYISKVLEDYPFYAHPNDRARIKKVEKVPATKEEKKFYSKENCYDLYRDFGILGCGAPRGTSK